MIRIFYVKEKTKKNPKMAIIYININNSVAGTFSNILLLQWKNISLPYNHACQIIFKKFSWHYNDNYQ